MDEKKTPPRSRFRIWSVRLAWFVLLLPFAVRLFLPSLVRAGLPEFGIRRLGARLDVRNVDIDFFAGRLTLEGGALKAPDGFATRELLTFNRLVMIFDYAEFAQGRLVIRMLEIDGANLTLERSRDGRHNLAEFMKNIPRRPPREDAVRQLDVFEINLIRVRDARIVYADRRGGLLGRAESWSRFTELSGTITGIRSPAEEIPILIRAQGNHNNDPARFDVTIYPVSGDVKGLVRFSGLLDRSLVFVNNLRDDSEMMMLDSVLLTTRSNLEGYGKRVLSLVFDPGRKLVVEAADKALDIPSILWRTVEIATWPIKKVHEEISGTGKN